MQYKEVDSGVWVRGIQGYDDLLFSSPRKAYEAIQPFLEEHGGLGKTHSPRKHSKKSIRMSMETGKPPSPGPSMDRRKSSRTTPTSSSCPSAGKAADMATTATIASSCLSGETKAPRSPRKDSPFPINGGGPASQGIRPKSRWVSRTSTSNPVAQAIS